MVFCYSFNTLQREWVEWVESGGELGEVCGKQLNPSLNTLGEDMMPIGAHVMVHATLLGYRDIQSALGAI